MYAANDESIINASVEFDEKTLQPTYKLLLGLAGASSGIEIARRFGITQPVIDAARENLDISAQEAENYLKKLQTETKIATDLRLALEEEREAVAMKYAGLENEAVKKEKARQKEFEGELANAIDEFDRQSKAFMQTIEDKTLKNKLEKERMTRKAELNRAVMSKVQSPRSKFGGGESVSVPGAIATGDLTVGSRVITSFGNIGTIEKMDKEVAEVLVGGMRLREKLANLQLAEPPASRRTERGSKIHTARTRRFHLPRHRRPRHPGRTQPHRQNHRRRRIRDRPLPRRSLHVIPPPRPHHPRLRHRRAKKLRPSLPKRPSTRRKVRLRPVRSGRKWCDDRGVKIVVMRIKTLILFLLLLSVFRSTFSQDEAKAQLVDEFGVTNCDDILARVDNFFLILHNSSEKPHGVFSITGSSTELVKMLNVEQTLRVAVLQRRYDPKSVTISRSGSDKPLTV